MNTIHPLYLMSLSKGQTDSITSNKEVLILPYEDISFISSLIR